MDVLKLCVSQGGAQAFNLGVPILEEELQERTNAAACLPRSAHKQANAVKFRFATRALPAYNPISGGSRCRGHGDGSASDRGSVSGSSHDGQSG